MAWQAKIKNDVLWSHDLYCSVNVIVHIKKKAIRNLDELFEKKTLLREDGPNNDSNIQKLLSGRINYIIMSNLEYNYYKKKYPNLDFANFEMDSVLTECALSLKITLTLIRLNQAIDSIKKNGTLDKIRKSYSLTFNILKKFFRPLIPQRRILWGSNRRIYAKKSHRYLARKYATRPRGNLHRERSP